MSRTDLGPNGSALNTLGKYPSVVRVGRLMVNAIDLDHASEMIVEAASCGRGSAVHLVNAYTVSFAQEDSSYARCINGSWLRLADGRPLQWLSMLRGDRHRLTQVRGADLMSRVLSDGRQHGLKHYLLGSTDQVSKDLTRRIVTSFEGVEIVGSESPPFRELTAEERLHQLERLRNSGAQVIWVGLGTPKQDAEVAAFALEVGAVCIAVGAAFELLAGTQRTPPQWVSRSGLEWLFRLVNEPRRLWRRYFVANPVFIGVMIRSIFRRGPRK